MAASKRFLMFSLGIRTGSKKNSGFKRLAGPVFLDFHKKYAQVVNPNLLYVANRSCFLDVFSKNMYSVVNTVL